MLFGFTIDWLLSRSWERGVVEMLFAARVFWDHLSRI